MPEARLYDHSIPHYGCTGLRLIESVSLIRLTNNLGRIMSLFLTV